MNPFIFLLASFFVSLTAMSGSLFYSEVMYYYPCSLCWIQRFLMYPLNLIFLVALFKRDYRIYHYVLPFSLAGWCVAAYHYFLQWDLIPKEACYDATCNTRYVDWLGFITIPFQSFLAFTLITVLMALLWKKAR